MPMMQFPSYHASLGVLALVVLVSWATPVWGAGIDSEHRYVWGENIGWIDFGSPQGAVTVSATGMTGYAWGENVGWISLSCANTSSCGTVDYGVTKSGSVVSGYAWGENVGWISFNCANTSSCGTVDYGVTFDIANAGFGGYAWGENVGWISLNCANTASCTTVNHRLFAGVTAASVSQPFVGGGPGPAAPPVIPFVGIGATASPTPPSTPAPTVIASSLPRTPAPTATGQYRPIVPAPSVAPFWSGESEYVPPAPGPVEPTEPPTQAQPTAAPPMPVPEESGPVVEAISGVAGALDGASTVIARTLGAIADESCQGVVGATACVSGTITTLIVLIVGAMGLQAGHVLLRSGLVDQAIATSIVLGIVTLPLNVMSAPSIARGLALLVFLIASAVWVLVMRKPAGVVVDRATGLPFAFARITLSDEAGKEVAATTTDEHGRYLLSAPQGHVYDLGVVGPATEGAQRVTHQQVSVGVGLGGASWITSTVRI